MTVSTAWLRSELPYLWPIAWILGALVAGAIADRWFLRCFLLRANFVRQHPWLRLGLEAMRGGVFFWFLIAGIHAAMITSPMDRNVVRILDDVLLVLGFGSLTWVAARFAGGAIHTHAESLGERVLSASLLATIAQSIIVIIGVLVIFQSLGIAIEPLLTALGVGGLAVALALQPTLANLFAGIQLVASRNLRPGDFVSVTGYEGYVEDVTWRTTSIRDVTNNLVIVPNQTIATSAFVNYRLGSGEMAVELPFVVKAGNDPDEVERKAIDAANEALRALGAKASDGAPPAVRFQQLSGGDIQAQLVLQVPRSVDPARARNETLKRLFTALGSQAAPSASKSTSSS